MKRNPKLESELLKNPKDTDTWAVYADWLTEQDDPQGPILGKGITGQNISSEIDAHAESLLGDVLKEAWDKAKAAKSKKDYYSESQSKAVRLKWSPYGFLREARIADVYERDGPPLDELLPALLMCSAARFIEGLTLGLWVADDENDYSSAYESIVQTGPHPWLQRLFIGDFVYPDETEISWTMVGNVAKVLPFLPNLKSLKLRGSDVGLAPLKHERLEALSIESGGVGEAAVKAIGHAQLPSLKKLEVWLGTEDYGGGGSIDLLDPLFEGDGYPKLETLGLMNGEYPADILSQLQGSKLLPRLKAIDLSMSVLQDDDVAPLVSEDDKFQHLERIDLSEGFLSEDMQATLEKLYEGKIILSEQRTEEDYGYYTVVGE